MTAEVFDPTPCALGEGPLWHPMREQFFWFDILKFRLHAREGDKTRAWAFDEHVSAAGWIDKHTLLIASETKLFAFDLDRGASETVVSLEADHRNTRSNDGRADPFGGFWIGTMSKSGENGKGTIQRYFRGELRTLYRDITIPNAIAFSPDGSLATFADTRRRTVWQQALSGKDGWPVGEPEVFLDFSSANLDPDGAVFDAAGNFWVAQWNAGRVDCYAPNRQLLRAIPMGAPQTTCPAFGGSDLSDLYCTSARQRLPKETLADGRPHGATFIVGNAGKGQAEHRVIL